MFVCQIFDSHKFSIIRIRKSRFQLTNAYVDGPLDSYIKKYYFIAQLSNVLNNETINVPYLWS